MASAVTGSSTESASVNYDQFLLDLKDNDKDKDEDKDKDKDKDEDEDEDKDKKPKTFVIDVRELSEVRDRKIEGAIHIPLDDVKNTFENISNEEFKQTYGREKPTLNQKIVFVCHSGRRSMCAQKTIQKLGYTNVYYYMGGWMEWNKKEEEKKQKEIEEKKQKEEEKTKGRRKK